MFAELLYYSCGILSVRLQFKREDGDGDGHDDDDDDDDGDDGDDGMAN